MPRQGDGNSPAYKLHNGREARVVIQNTWDKYLTVATEPSRRQFLRADKQYFYDQDDIFVLAPRNAKHKVSLRHERTGRYVSVNGNGVVHCDAVSAGNDQTLKLREGWSGFTLCSAHGRYLSAQKDGSVICSRMWALYWENWKIRRVGWVDEAHDDAEAMRIGTQRGKKMGGPRRDVGSQGSFSQSQRAHLASASASSMSLELSVSEDEDESASGDDEPMEDEKMAEERNRLANSSPHSMAARESTPRAPEEVRYVNYFKKYESKIMDDVGALASMRSDLATQDEKETSHGHSMRAWASMCDTAAEKGKKLARYERLVAKISRRKMGRSRKRDDLDEQLHDTKAQIERNDLDLKKLRDEIPPLQESVRKLKTEVGELDAEIARLCAMKDEKESELEMYVAREKEKGFVMQQLEERAAMLGNNQRVFEMQKEDQTRLDSTIRVYEKELSRLFDSLEERQAKLESESEQWSNEDLVVWLQRVCEKRFRKQKHFIAAVRKGKCRGQDLPLMNETRLEELGLKREEDRKSLVEEIVRILGRPMDDLDLLGGAETLTRGASTERNKCVVCMDGIADRICLPCGHLCVCKDCEGEIKNSGQCAFCGQPLADMVRVFQVGV